MHRLLVVGMALLAFGRISMAGIEVGSIAVYSDGDVEKLVEIAPGKTVWEDDRKRRYVRSDNPMLPVLEREDFLSGRGYRQTLIKGEPASYRSLEPGQHVLFDMRRTRHDGRTSTREWDCEYLGDTRKKVLKLHRTLHNFSCERFKTHHKLYYRVFKERRRFSYSEELGLIVRMKRETPRKKSSRKLEALFAPDEVTYRKLSKLVRQIRKGGKEGRK